MKNKEIEDLRELLSLPLSHENGGILRAQLTECESWLPYVSQKYREAKRELADIRLAGLPEKDKSKTDLDRETYQASYSAKAQQSVDELRDLFSIIQQRISLGQTILKNIQTEIERL